MIWSMKLLLFLLFVNALSRMECDSERDWQNYDSDNYETEGDEWIFKNVYLYKIVNLSIYFSKWQFQYEIAIALWNSLKISNK